MQLTRIFTAALLPLVFAQDTTSGTTTVTQTSTLTKTITLASNTVTMLATATGNVTSHATGTGANTASYTAKATGTSETPGVNGLGNGAASLGASAAQVVAAGVAGMLVVALM